MRREELRAAAELFAENFRLNTGKSWVTAAAVLCMVPLYRGISNLDALHSAECLNEAAVFAGILLLTPAGAPEQDRRIRELIRSKYIRRIAVIMLRLLMAAAAAAVSIAVFAMVMRSCGCRFPYAEYTAAAVMRAFLFGGTGAAAGLGAENVIVGYLVAAGMYLLF